MHVCEAKQYKKSLIRLILIYLHEVFFVFLVEIGDIVAVTLIGIIKGELSYQI